MKALEDLHELITADVDSGHFTQGIFEIEVASQIAALRRCFTHHDLLICDDLRSQIHDSELGQVGTP